MIEHWPWYVSGLALAAVPVFHWLGLRRNLAVSGRFTAIINQLRFGDPNPKVEISQEEFLAAVREATIAAMGAEAVQTPVTSGELQLNRPPGMTFPSHLVFLGAMVAGGFLSANLAGGYAPAFTIQSELFHNIFGGSTGVTVGVLAAGGVLVGFGTRMAAGCTTGHGLCGVSRFQKGSLAATMAFFGAAVVVSMILKVVAS